jgi:hypothetical protein
MSFPSRSTVLAAAAAALLAGCATVPKAAPDADLAAKQFPAPTPGHAAVYVYRNELLGSAVRMTVLLNGQHVGDTASRSFLWFWVAPGKHQLLSMPGSATLELDAKPGASYFVWQEVKMGAWSPGSRLHLVDEATGKAGVSECSLAAGAGQP